eukprot:jgi/Mesvir1/6911/Mv25045-RA.1
MKLLWFYTGILLFVFAVLQGLQYGNAACSDAAVITLGAGAGRYSISASNEKSTLSAVRLCPGIDQTSGEQPGDLTEPAPTDWYHFFADFPGTYVFEAAAASFDTVFHLYSSDRSCDTLTCIVSNDDLESGVLRSRVEAWLDPDLSYYLAVQGYLKATGSYTLDVTTCPTGWQQGLESPACFQLLPDVVTFDSAQRLCQDLSSATCASSTVPCLPAYPAWINDVEDMRDMAEVVPEDAQVWMGGVQAAGSLEPGAGWSWLSGDPWSDAFWDAGQPDNHDAPSEQCTILWKTAARVSAAYVLHDVPCAIQRATMCRLADPRAKSKMLGSCFRVEGTRPLALTDATISIAGTTDYLDASIAGCSSSVGSAEVTAPTSWLTFQVPRGDIWVLEVDEFADRPGAEFSVANDSVLHLFRSTDGTCETLACLASDDDGGDSALSRIQADLVAGVTYFVAVRAYNGQSADYVLNFTSEWCSS